VHSATELTRQVASSHTGDIMRLSILRGGENLTIEVRSGLRPSEEELAKTQGNMEQGGEGQGEGGSAHTGALGLVLSPLDADARRKLGLPADLKGALITDIDTTSDAAGKGLKPGDVVIRVNDKAVFNGADVAQEVAAAQKAGRANVLLFVYHDHHQAAVAVKIVPDSDDGDAPAKGKGKPK
jgi:serine protease Do